MRIVRIGGWFKFGCEGHPVLQFLVQRRSPSKEQVYAFMVSFLVQGSEVVVYRVHFSQVCWLLHCRRDTLWLHLEVKRYVHTHHIRHKHTKNWARQNMTGVHSPRATRLETVCMLFHKENNNRRRRKLCKTGLWSASATRINKIRFGGRDVVVAISTSYLYWMQTNALTCLTTLLFVFLCHFSWGENWCENEVGKVADIGRSWW